MINNTNLTKILPRNQHLALVDRGYWPLLQALRKDKKENIFDCICPCLSNESIVSTLDINLSRLCTRCRWIIEAVFGVLKQQWKILSDPIHSKRKGWINSIIKSIFATHNFK